MKIFFALPIFVLMTTVGISQAIYKIDASLLADSQSNTKVEYIVLMKDRATFEAKPTFKTKDQKATYVYNSLVNKADVIQKDIKAYLDNSAISYQSFYITNAIRVTSTKEVMYQVSSRADVAKIIDNAYFKMLDTSIDRQESLRGGEPEWGIKMIQADSVWAMGIRGQGVVIAGQDTGYDWQVSPLRAKYRGTIDSLSADHNYNWHDAILFNSPQYPDTLLNPCGFGSTQPCDDNNHGTHTMGTMVGEDDENSIGIAPDSKWIACRNMDRGWGRPSSYMECFEWFLAPYDLNGNNADPSKSPHVINNSWYCSEEEGCNPSNWLLMEDIVKNLKAAGVVVVVSAGNSGSQGCGSVTGPPAFFESSFSVGATTSSDTIANFSSRGPVVIDSSFRLKPNVSAPGQGVRSVIRGGSFASFSGTSMAGPHVAGLVGLIICANPVLAGQVDIIEDIIEATAVPKISTMDCGDFLGSEVPNAVFGYGRVDALAAVKRALEFSVDTDDTPLHVSLAVYPNPSDDLITFHIKNQQTSIDRIKIYHINGQVVINKNISGNQILTTLSVSELPKGIYLYEVHSGDQLLRGKFVKD